MFGIGDGVSARADVSRNMAVSSTTSLGFVGMPAGRVPKGEISCALFCGGRGRDGAGLTISTSMSVEDDIRSATAVNDCDGEDCESLEYEGELAGLILADRSLNARSASLFFLLRVMAIMRHVRFSRREPLGRVSFALV